MLTANSAAAPYQHSQADRSTAQLNLDRTVVWLMESLSKRRFRWWSSFLIIGVPDTTLIQRPHK
jgi:hypothetical protein